MAVEGRFAELERKRLARLGHEWFEKVEKQRAPFSVVSTEEKRPIAFRRVTIRRAHRPHGPPRERAATPSSTTNR